MPAPFSLLFPPFLQSVTKGPDGQVTALAGQLHLAGDFKKTRLKLTWLADVPELVPLTLTDFDCLITKKKVC
jgi:glutamyl-tRNA synthetase